MEKAFKILKELQSTSGSNEKERIIRDNLGNELFDYILRFLFDNLLVTGIARKKLNKYTNTPPTKLPRFKDIPELVSYVLSHNTGDELTVTDFVSHAKCFATREFEDIEITEMIYSIICKDLKLGCQASTYNKANPSNPIYVHGNMGGKAWDEDRALKLIDKGETLYFSEKVDGNKGTRKIDITEMVSRNGLEWEGTQTILSELNKSLVSDFIPEGELVYNDTTGTMTSQQIRAKTSSIMGDKSIKDKTEAGIILRIFDMPRKEDVNETDVGETYVQRRARMDEYSAQLERDDIKFVKVIPIEFTVSTREELAQVMPRLKAYIESGHEGFMCIASSQVYKVGKGYQMMKLKNVLTADLRISKWNLGKEKTKLEGKFGSFDVDFPYVDADGKFGVYQVTVGMGYSDSFRSEVDKDPDSHIGKIIEILVTEVSKNKEGGYSLSYARMVEIRRDKDTIDLEKHTLVEIEGEWYFKGDNLIVDDED